VLDWNCRLGDAEKIGKREERERGLFLFWCAHDPALIKKSLAKRAFNHPQKARWQRERTGGAQHLLTDSSTASLVQMLWGK